MTRLGAAARRRILAGGPTSRHRDALSREGYERLRSMIVDGRAGLRCENCRLADITGELEHAIPRSKGGADSWKTCWCPCPSCRNAKIAVFSSGRLLVDPFGDGRFRFRLVVARSKADFSRGNYELLYDRIGGRVATKDERDMLSTLQ